MSFVRKRAIKGSVTMPLADYTKLIEENMKLKSIFKLRTSYSGRLDLSVEKEDAYHLAIDMFNGRFSTDEYDVKSFDETYGMDMTIAEKKKEQEEE